MNESWECKDRSVTSLIYLCSKNMQEKQFILQCDSNIDALIYIVHQTSVVDTDGIEMCFILQQCLKQLTSRIYQKIISYTNISKYKNVSLQIHIIPLHIRVVRNKKPTYFHFFALKTDNALFCHQDIPTIHNGYCVSNGVDYAKKNYVLSTFCQHSHLNKEPGNNRFLH